MTEERKLPLHIRQREACHLGKDLKLIHIFEKVPDPRGPSLGFARMASMSTTTTMTTTTLALRPCGDPVIFPLLNSQRGTDLIQPPIIFPIS